MNAVGLEVTIEEVSARTAALAILAVLMLLAVAKVHSEVLLG